MVHLPHTGRTLRRGDSRGPLSVALPRLLGVTLIAAASLAGTRERAGAADAPATGSPAPLGLSVVHVDRVLVLDGVPRDAPVHAFALDDRGDAFLRPQGAPWPRWILESRGGSTPLGALAAAMSAPPRFDPRSERWLFSAAPRVEGPPADPERDAGIAVWSAARDGDGVALVYPPDAPLAARNFLLLDLHPDEPSLLVAAGSRERPARELVELRLGEGAPALRELGRRLAPGGLARYAEGGVARVDPRVEHAASDGRIAHCPTPHRGRSGPDPYRTVLVRQAGGGWRPIVVSAPAGALAAAGLEPPITLLDRRGDRALVRVGPRADDRYAIVTLGDAPEPRRYPEPDAPGALLRLPPGFVAGERLAAVHPSARETVARLAASFAGPRPASVRARLELRNAPDGDVLSTVHVEESGDGRIRLEHRLGDEPFVTLGFDGTSCWIRESDGDVRRDAAAALCAEIEAYSVLRHVFDPAGLADPRLAWRAVSSAPARGGAADDDDDDGGDGDGGGDDAALAFDYADGYGGRLRLARDGDALLPAEWTSTAGGATTTLRCGGWGDHEGRRIPRELRFDGPTGGFVITVAELESGVELAPARFEPPAR